MHDSEKLEFRRVMARALKDAHIVTTPTFEQWTRQMLIRLDQMEIHLARMTQQMEEMRKRLEEVEKGQPAKPETTPGND
jgi:hypothetical protein